MRVCRDVVETALTFIGLIVMHNQLKPESLGAIQLLQSARIRCVMVTGIGNVLEACMYC